MGIAKRTHYGDYFHVRTKADPNNLAYTGVGLGGYHVSRYWLQCPPLTRASHRPALLPLHPRHAVAPLHPADTGHHPAHPHASRVTCHVTRHVSPVTSHVSRVMRHTAGAGRRQPVRGRVPRGGQAQGGAPGHLQAAQVRLSNTQPPAISNT